MSKEEKDRVEKEEFPPALDEEINEKGCNDDQQ